MMLRKNLLTLGVCAALGSGAVWAQDQFAMAAAPAPQDYSGIEVINGGVDLDQADAIERMQTRYPLRVEISGKGGNYYVADRVKLMKDGDLLAEIPNAGPWLLIDVPPGRYTLVGVFSGTELKRNVVVPKDGTKVSWVVPPTIE